MSIPVEPHYLYSIKMQSSYTWLKMICEFIDNSLGANATNVTLSWPGGQVFAIKDDGHGTDDLMRMLTLGASRERDASDIGYYGVGAKHALIWLWGESLIRSTTPIGTTSQITVKWDDIARGEAQYPTSSDIVVSGGFGEEHGTLIHCQTEKRYPTIRELIRSVSNIYTPGIESGRTLWWSERQNRRQRIQARQWPKTSKEINEQILAAGREVTVRMGIVADGEKNPYMNGFSFERSFRVIKESTLGANGFSVSRLAARITLGADWKLSTNKDDFTEFQDELADAIYDRCQELMREASEQAVSIEDDAFNRELANRILDAASTRREKRPNQGSSTGPIEPKETGQKRQRASVTSDEAGSIVDKVAQRNKRGIQIEKYEDTDSPTLGYYDPDGNRVRLNVANQWLSEKYKTRADDCVFSVICGILSDHATRETCKKSPLFKDEISKDFCTNWGNIVEMLADKEALML